MDVSVFIEGERFNYRVAGFITCGDYVLLQKTEGCDFWNMLGGRVHIGESSKEAFVREMKEELDLKEKKKSLKFIDLAENFFVWEDYNVQELLMIYKLDLPKEYFERLEGFAVIDGHGEKARWFKRDEVKNLVCLPELIYGLAEDDTQFKHTIVHE